MAELLQLGAEIYKVIQNPDGSSTLSSNKNSKGFKLKIHFSNNEEDHRQSVEAVKRILMPGIFKLL
jgi:hypothetical protein